MHFLRSFPALLVLLLLLQPAAAAPPDPLRLVPEHADFVVKIEQPRQLVDTVMGTELFKQLQAYAPVREIYDAGLFKRFFEIVYYFERELGADRFELLDRLAGHGAVVAAKFGEPTIVLLAIEGKDEAVVRKFKEVGLRLLEAELARLEVKAEIKKGSHRDIEGVRLGDDLYAATMGTTLLLSNKGEGIKAAIDQHFDKKKSIADKPGVIAARRLLPPDPLVWSYLDLSLVRLAPQFKPLFEMPNGNAAVPLLIGGYVDVLRRAPFAAAGFYRKSDGFLATVRLPAGREGMATESTLHIPTGDQPGSRPLLQPRDTLFSTSYFFDLAKIWEHRAKLLNEAQVAVLEGIDKGAGNLPGFSISKILGMTGPYQRIVVAAQRQPEYKIQPTQRLPAFAFTLEMRDPKGFQATIYPAILAAAVGASTQLQLKSMEEKIGEHKLVGYRFPEDGKLAIDTNNLRFNFSPCYAFVGNQFLICSTLELGRELVATLDKEAKDETGHAATGRTLLSGAGGALVLQQLEEQLFVQAMLERALTPDTAKKEVQALLDILKRAGKLQLEAVYGAKEFRYDFELKFGP